MDYDSDFDDDEPQRREKTDSYSDLEQTTESDFLYEPHPESSDKNIVVKEVWNMRPGEKVKTWERINNHMMDFIKTLTPRQRENGLTIDQLRRHMEKFFDLRLTSHCIGRLYNFPKYFYHKSFNCGETFIILYFYKNQLE